MFDEEFERELVTTAPALRCTTAASGDTAFGFSSSEMRSTSPDRLEFLLKGRYGLFLSLRRLRITANVM